MTEEEINKLTFSMVSHINYGAYHTSTYRCDNAPKGHTIFIRRVVEYNERTQEPIGLGEDTYIIDKEEFEGFEAAKQRLFEL